MMTMGFVWTTEKALALLTGMVLYMVVKIGDYYNVKDQKEAKAR